MLLQKIKERKTAIIILGLAVLLIGIDRLTKWAIVNNIEYGMSVPGIRIGSLRLIDITHYHNNGAAFGILEGRQVLLIAVTGLLLAGAIVVLLSGRIKSRWLMSAIGLIIAGGIGNFIDRASQGYVVDFIELKFIHFAIFNFADMCAVTGSVLLLFVVLSDEIRDYKAKKACDDTVDATKENE